MYAMPQYQSIYTHNALQQTNSFCLDGPQTACLDGPQEYIPNYCFVYITVQGKGTKFFWLLVIEKVDSFAA